MGDTQDFNKNFIKRKRSLLIPLKKFHFFGQNCLGWYSRVFITMATTSWWLVSSPGGFCAIFRWWCRKINGDQPSEQRLVMMTLQQWNELQCQNTKLTGKLQKSSLDLINYWIFKRFLRKMEPKQFSIESLYFVKDLFNRWKCSCPRSLKVLLRVNAFVIHTKKII